MTPQISSDVLIDAAVDEVWKLTVDVEAWPTMTPTMTKVERLDDGPMRVGSRARVTQPRQRPAIWTVTRLEAPHVFEWQAKVGTVTMTGAHHLAAEGNGCRNQLRLDLTGFGSALLARLLGSTMRRAITTENEGFKRTAEASRSAPSR